MGRSAFTTRHSSTSSTLGDGSVSTEYLRLMEAGTEARGLRLAPLLAASGIDPAVLQQRGARVSHDPVERLWSQVAERLRDPLFALKLASDIPFGSGDLIDYLLGSSANVGDALQRLTRYMPLLCGGDRSRVVISGELASLRFQPPGELPYQCELAVGLFVRRSRETFGPSWRIKHVSFRHAPLGPSASYDRVFQVPVHFGMPFEEAVFARDLLSLPLAGADARLTSILAAQAEAMLAALRPPAPQVSFLDSVQRAIQDGLVQGDSSLSSVAERLSLSPRTLQRRLRAGGISHRHLLQQLRQDLARRALDEPVSQGHIARTLGYASAATFHRAWRSWPGAHAARRQS